MKSIENSKSSSYNALGWSVIVLVTLAAFFATYSFQLSSPIIAMIWIGWFSISLAAGYITTQGQQVFCFGKEAKIELQKVVWPTRQETVQTTSIIMAMVALTGFILWGIDSGMMWVIGKITHLG